MTRFSIPLFLFSCVEYKLNNNLDDNLGTEGGYGNDEQYIPGYPDPEICDREDHLQTNITSIEDCTIEPEVGVLDAVIEWQKTSFVLYPEYNQTVMAPVIGQLTDDNEDGVIDQLDTPDIVIITDDGGTNDNKHGVLRILSGNDGSELLAVNRSDFEDAQVYPYRYANIAIGDVDFDLAPEIITLAEVLTIPSEIPVEDTAMDSATDSSVPVPMPSDSMGGGDTMDSGEGPIGEPENGDNPIKPTPPQYSDDPEGPSEGGGASPPVIGCHLVAYDTNLNVEWISPALDDDCGGHAPALADLEGDGEVEVVLGPYIFRGPTGALRAKGGMDSGRFLAYAEIGFHSIISDLDNDGTQEIIAGRSVYDATGTLICQGDGPQDGFTAAADLDMDGMGEFVVVGNQTATLYDTDCSIISMWALQGGGTGGPPTIADYDGDGLPEIGLVDASTYSVYEIDGSVRWSTPVFDMSSHATGSVVFDFEGDGYPEVVYADELNLWVFDGRSGAVRLRDQSHNSRTLHEYPTIADLDGDGSAEIVVVNGGSHYNSTSTGIFVVGSQTSNWQAGRQVWNQHAYSITNINDDLTIPSPAIPNWPTYNNFRSGDLNPVSASGFPDAIAFAEACELECYLDRIVVHIKVANQGTSALRNGIPVEVGTYDGDTYYPLDIGFTSTVLQPGESSESIRFRIDLEDVSEQRLYITVDHLDYAAECNESNNKIPLDITCEHE
jgi:hypothetical protein